MTRLVAGVDEAGRGPLAGRVYAAAVILPADASFPADMDSKKLSPKRRRAWFDTIQLNAVAYAIRWAEVEEIDELNILQASLLAMRRAVDGLNVRPDSVLVDGGHVPQCPVPVRAVIGGDGSVTSIGAASVLAKVARDDYMTDLDDCYPQYGFAKHKGYPTRDHMAALSTFGPCPVHRRCFAPVARCLRDRDTGSSTD